jgi:3-methyladenine DNA glycosylase AlkD
MKYIKRAGAKDSSLQGVSSDDLFRMASKINKMLRRQLRTGKPAVEEVPVVEEVAVEETVQTQTIASNVIDQLENEPAKPTGWFGGKKK